MFKTKPKLSVIIVTYNAAAYLQRCLNSIFVQDKDHSIDVVIIDGQSTDGTLEIIQRYHSQIAFWLSEPDLGIYDAMNKALLYVNSDWVYFMGADDELLPGFFEMIPYLVKPDTIYYGSVMADGEKKLGKLTTYQIAKFGIYHQAIIFPRSVFTKHYYNTEYKISADYALLLEIYGSKRFQFEYLEFILAKYNITGMSSKHVDLKFQKNKGALILKNFGLVTAIRYYIHKLKHQDNPRA